MRSQNAKNKGKRRVEAHRNEHGKEFCHTIE